jgi:hypothetical protein
LNNHQAFGLFCETNLPRTDDKLVNFLTPFI